MHFLGKNVIFLTHISSVQRCTLTTPTHATWYASCPNPFLPSCQILGCLAHCKGVRVHFFSYFMCERGLFAIRNYETFLYFGFGVGFFWGGILGISLAFIFIFLETTSCVCVFVLEKTSCVCIFWAKTSFCFNIISEYFSRVFSILPRFQRQCPFEPARRFTVIACTLGWLSGRGKNNWLVRLHPVCVDDETPKVEAGLLLILPLVFVQMKFEKQNKKYRPILSHSKLPYLLLLWEKTGSWKENRPRGQNDRFVALLRLQQRSWKGAAGAKVRRWGREVTRGARSSEESEALRARIFREGD
jgi:hypothetical protein